MRLLRGELKWLEHDADGKQVVNLREWNLFAHHLGPDRVCTLYAARNLIFNAVAVQGLDNWGIELADILLACGRCFVDLASNLLVLLREAVLHAEILQLRFDGVQAKTIGQRSEEVNGLARNLNLLILGHSAQCAHIVQAVGNLDKDNAHIVRQGEQHLAEILRLTRCVGIEDARHLGQSIDHRCNLLAEDMLHILHRVVGILHHVVKEGCNHRFYAQTYLVNNNLCHCNRMQEVRLARTASYTLMCLLGKEIGTLDEVPILLVFANLLARFCEYIPLSLDQYLVLCSIIHSFSLIDGLYKRHGTNTLRCLCSALF